MTRFWIFIAAMMLAMLLIFFVLQAMNLPVFAESPDFMLGQEKWAAPLVGVGLLIVDVLAPVPSSMVMFAHGILFGVFWGSLLSLTGGCGATAVGYLLGAGGEKRISRWVGNESRDRAQRFFDRYGLIAVIVSRPVPILAETIAITAGLSGMKFRAVLLASILGYLPAAILYAVAGAYAVDLQSGLYAFLIVMVLAAITWGLGRFLLRPRTTSAENE